jgi:hypothetical protein
MKLGDLTTLGNLKDWLATSNYVQGTSSGVSIDRLYARMISRVSADILAYLERPWLLPKDYVNEQYSGSGGCTVILRNYPVLSVSSVSACGVVISPSSTLIPSNGYTLSAWNGQPPGSHQKIVGAPFQAGSQNILVSYRAGYQVTNEAYDIPAASGSNSTTKITLNQLYGIWAQDGGVVYASDNTPFVRVTDPPTAVGQYRVLPVYEGSPLSEPGIYEFYKDDAAASVLITYGFIPAALEEAALQYVAERLAYRSRVGEMSRTVQQQVTVRYDLSDIPAQIKRQLQPFKSTLPI